MRQSGTSRLRSDVSTSVIATLTSAGTRKDVADANTFLCTAQTKARCLTVSNAESASQMPLGQQSWADFDWSVSASGRTPSSTSTFADMSRLTLLERRGG